MVITGNCLLNVKISGAIFLFIIIKELYYMKIRNSSPYFHRLFIIYLRPEVRSLKE